MLLKHFHLDQKLSLHITCLQIITLQISARKLLLFHWTPLPDIVQSSMQLPVSWCKFYQRFTRSFYVHRSQKCKKTDGLTVFFALLGSVLIKVSCKIFVKFSQGDNAQLCGGKGAMSVFNLKNDTGESSVHKLIPDLFELKRLLKHIN